VITEVSFKKQISTGSHYSKTEVAKIYTMFASSCAGIVIYYGLFQFAVCTVKTKLSF